MKTKLLISLLLTCLIACKDEPQQAEYPFTLRFSYMEQAGFRMFVGEGEIKDQNRIREYILSKKQESENPFYLYQNNFPYSTEDVSFTYRSVDSIWISTENKDTKYFDKPWTVKNIDDVQYWEAQDTLSFIPIRQIPTCMGITEKRPSLLKYSPLYSEEVIIPSSSGFSQLTKIKPCYYLLAEKGQLYFPYLIILQPYPFGSHAFSIEQNAFNEAYASHICDGDTLVIQERKYFLVGENK